MKPKHLLSILITINLFLATFGQTTEPETKLRTQNLDTVYGWKKGGVAVLNISQTSLTNWAAGGQNSLSLNGLFSIYAKLKKENSFWDNSLDVGYGVLKQGKGAAFMKTDDKIDLLSSYGRKAAKNLYYAALFNFKTQMAAGYNYPNDSVKISDFLAPAYIVCALGMDYKPNNYLGMFVAPLTSKTTIVNNQTLANEGAFGVEAAKYDTSGKILKEGKKVWYEFGGYIRVIYTKNDFKSELLKNLSLSTKLDLFSNYLKKPQNIVVNWETLITMKVNKYLAANLSAQLAYDDNVTTTEVKPDGTTIHIGPKIQFKEILGIGFSYKF
jgi:Protein of unknown function (DUF3078)